MELQHTEKSSQEQARKEPMARVEIDVIPDVQVIPPGIAVPHGKHTVRVFASDLRVLQSMVERNTAAMERATADHESALSQAISTGVEGLQDLEAEQEEKKIRQTFRGSPAAMFQRNEHRDPCPLRSCTVIEEGLPPLVNEARSEAEMKMAAVIAAEVAKAVAKAVAEQMAGHAAGKKG